MYIAIYIWLQMYFRTMTQSINNMSIDSPSSAPNPEEVYELPPPPTQSFNTSEECHQFLQNWAKNNGYAVICTASNSVNQTVCYACDKSGRYRPSNSKTEPSQTYKTRKTGCPFAVNGNFYKKTGLWTISIVWPHHNHLAQDTPARSLFN